MLASSSTYAVVSEPHKYLLSFARWKKIIGKKARVNESVNFCKVVCLKCLSVCLNVYIWLSFLSFIFVISLSFLFGLCSFFPSPFPLHSPFLLLLPLPPQVNSGVFEITRLNVYIWLSFYHLYLFVYLFDWYSTDESNDHS